MGFTTPNEQDVVYPQLSGWYQLDVDTVVSGLQYSNGCLSGAGVMLNGTDLNIDVDHGILMVNGNSFEMPSGSFTLVPDPSLDMFFIIEGDQSGPQITYGNPADAPVPPPVSEDFAIIYLGFLPAGATAVTYDNFVQKGLAYNMTPIELGGTGATTAADARTNLGLGSAAVASTSDFDAAGTAASAVGTHASALDPHGDRAYADSAVSTHAGADDPHGDRAYADTVVGIEASARSSADSGLDTRIGSLETTTATYGDIVTHDVAEFDAAGDAAAAVATHEGLSDPHPQYLTVTEGNNAYQPLDGDLTALAALSTAGIAVRTAGSTWALRQLDVGSAKISITNANGVGGNPTIDLGSVASTALSDSSIIVRTSDNASITQTMMASNSVGSSQIQGSAISNTHIAAAAAIAATKISGTAVTLADTGTVTNTMLAGSIAASKITGTAITAADTGTVTDTMLAGSISASKITGTAVTQADTGTVTSTMIADGTIMNADINASAAIAVSKISGLGTIATQAASNVSITGGSITGITDLAVADGGTGSSSLTQYAVLVGAGTSAIAAVSPGSSGTVLMSNGASANPSFQAVPDSPAVYILSRQQFK